MSDGEGVRAADGERADPVAGDGDLAAELELLAEENRRLREEYRRARQARYRRTALGMAALGAVALGGAALFPGVREVLLALSGIGLFAAVLLYALTPERFVAADVGERAFDAHVDTGEAIVADLALADDRVYLPGGGDARLFVPQTEGTDPPAPGESDRVFVVDDAHRGVALPASGAGLYRVFERDLTRSLADDPGALADQAADALVSGFELVGDARPDVGDGRVTVAVDDSAFGPVDRFDHPVASFLGVAVATGMEEPATVEVADGDERADELVTVRWDAGD